VKRREGRDGNKRRKGRKVNGREAMGGRAK
jgi:hypothetical protein